MGSPRRHDWRFKIVLARIPLNLRMVCRFLAFGTLLCFAACQFHSDMQHEGDERLQGIWVQDSIPLQDQLLEYTRHEFKFTCDSIYVTMRTFSNVQRLTDSCYQAGHWNEYAKGVYVVRGDSLLVDGLYTREDWRQKISGCHRSGQFLPRYKILAWSSDSITLENRFDQRPIHLRRTENITCVPKKRWE